MAAINEKFFFDQVRGTLFGGKLTPSQVAGMSAILTQWGTNYSTKDDRWLAYMLATTHHETDRKMQPIREYGLGKGRKYRVPDPQTGQVYYGRGFVQLTWRANYQKMAAVTGANLDKNPDLALQLPIATKILFYGMINGSFTGKKLANYFGPGLDNWTGARAIINGTDKAALIADYGHRYYAAISYTT